MKALSLIALVFAAFLIFLGYTSREKSGDVLGKAVMIGGAMILIFVAVVWILAFIKKREEKDGDFDDFDS